MAHRKLTIFPLLLNFETHYDIAMKESTIVILVIISLSVVSYHLTTTEKQRNIATESIKK